MRHRIAFALLTLICCASVLRAQTPPPDPIAQNLYPPELIMRYAGDIALDEKQRGAIKEAVQKAQAKFIDVQWQLQEESEKLVRLLQPKPIDEAAVLAQVDRVLSLEREVKKTQISLLVRLKNLLTDPQEHKLAELRKKSEGAGS